MDHINRQSQSVSEPQRTTRTYVACVSCRARKVKCILTDLPPCAKCKREHRECIFDTERKKPKHRNPPRWTRNDDLQRARHDALPGVSGGASGLQRSSANSPELLTTPSEPGRDTPATTQISRAPNPEVSASSSLPSISERLLSTVVTGSVDALETLSHAVENNGGHELARAQSRTDPIRATRSPNGTGLLMSRLSEVDDAVLDIWDKCRFVRQGWFTAQEAVTFIDLWDTPICLHCEECLLTLFSAVFSCTLRPCQPLISVNFENMKTTPHWYTTSHYYAVPCLSYPREPSYCREQEQQQEVTTSTNAYGNITSCCLNV
jgi:hypothetical protein